MANIKTLKDEPSRARRSKSSSCSCLKYRKPLRILCFLICMVSLLSTIFVNYTKSVQHCSEWAPSLLCMANRHCAYIQRSSGDNFWQDIIPFANPNNKCVKRGDIKDYMYKGVEKSIDLINKVGDKVQSVNDQVRKGLGSIFSFWKSPPSNSNSNSPDGSDQQVLNDANAQSNNEQAIVGSQYEFLNDEVITASDSKAGSYRLGKSEEQKKQPKKVLNDLKYYYDDEIGMGITRYEFGLWFITIGFFFLRKYLNTCGDQKTVFDFMNPKNQGQGIYYKPGSSAGGQGGVEPQDSLYIKNEKGELQKLTMSQVRQIREQLLSKKDKKNK